MELLAVGKYAEISQNVSNKISDLLDCEPIASLISHAGGQRVEQYVAAEIVKLAANVNINPTLNIKSHQIPTIAQGLIENYKWESLEDFTLCFRRAAAGLYGEIYRVDAAVIGQWFSRYLDEKYDALEQKKKKENGNSDDWKPLVKKYTPGYGKSVMQKYLEDLGVKTEQGNSAKDNEYQRVKLEYTPKGTEYLEQVNERIKDGQRKALIAKYPDANQETIEQILESDEYKRFRK